MPSRAEQSGFTLIEVLVAFTIALVLLVPLLHSFSTGLATGSRTDAFSNATLIAQSTLERLGSEATLNDKEKTEQQNGPYRIEISVRRYRGDGAPQRATRSVMEPYDVAVTVSWREGLRMRSVTLQGIRLGAQPITGRSS